ncbi:MAG: response regulator [Acidobacteria bacterium]|nr:response regulator [Acidobacteriota bacterium]
MAARVVVRDPQHQTRWEPSAVSPALRALEIVLAEDCRAHARWFELTMAETGLPFRLRTFSTGDRALGYLKSVAGERALQPDVVFLDINLPCMTGLDILRQMKMPGSGLEHLPVCLLTGSDQEREHAIAEFGLHRGCYIVKPLDRGNLRCALEAFGSLREYAEAVDAPWAKQKIGYDGRPASATWIVIEPCPPDLAWLRIVLAEAAEEVVIRHYSTEIAALADLCTWLATAELVLVNRHLPALTVSEFLDQLRTSPACAQIPVAVLLSAGDPPFHTSRFGPVDSFSKPLNGHQLQRIVLFARGRNGG